MDLIVDTSTERLQVILSDSVTFIQNKTTNPKHLKHLLPQIDNLLTQKCVDLSDIKTFCVVVGPGSFTGVRIGVSTIKAFSIVNKKAKLIAIDMLDLLEYKIRKMKSDICDFCIAIKSTSTKFYVSHQNKDSTKCFRKMLTIEELSEIITNKNMSLYSFVQDLTLNNVVATKVELDAKDYIEFVGILKEKKKYVSESDLRPVYMALSQAEEELAKKEKLKNA